MASCVGFIRYRRRLLSLLRDNNPETVYPNVWGLIGGGIDQGESALDAMRRECLEEIGLEEIEFMGLGDDGRGRHLFVASLSDQQASSFRLGNEGQALRFHSFEELAALDTTPKLREWLDDSPEAIRHIIESDLVSTECVLPLLCDQRYE